MSEDIVAVDVGSIYTKLAGNNCTVPSYLTRHAPLARGHRVGNIGYLDTVRINDDPTWYVFGENLTVHGDLSRIINNTGAARYYSEEYRRSIGYALFRLYAHEEPTKATIEPLVILSVPAEQFARHKDKIEANVVGKYTVRAMDESGKERVYKFKITLENLNILPEGAGTLLDFIQSESQGHIQSNYRNKTVAVASWGWYTLSVVIFKAGVHIANVTKSNDHVGAQTVSESIFSRLGIDKVDASLDEVDSMMRSGIVNHMGREYPILELMQDEVAIVGTAGLDWLQSQISNSHLNVSTLMFTGGTAEMFWPHLHLTEGDDNQYPMLSRLPNEIMKVKDAAREDADGAYRYFSYMVNR